MGEQRSAREDAEIILNPVTCAFENMLLELRRKHDVVESLLKENGQLRDQIAGNSRDLPELSSLEDQHRELLVAINEIGKRCVSGTLRSVALFWEEGKMIVLHAKADQVPLVKVVTRLD